ncbi:MAG: hypothetical protein H6R19_1982 [Proteobacteria bacterium]|nr:hypothetical protein [Pseudomonadota bacterium]
MLDKVQTQSIVWYLTGSLAASLVMTLIPTSAGAETPRLIAFFMTATNTCPSGWKPADYARQRLILSAANGNQGQTLGQTFSPGHPPQHVHQYIVAPEPVIFNEIPKQQKNTATATSAWSSGVPTAQNQDDPYQIKGETKGFDLNLPLFYATLCEEQNDSGIIDALPLSSVMYFTGNTCPQREDPALGWKPYIKAQGRFIVPKFKIVETETEPVAGTAWTESSFNGNLLRHDHDADAQYVKKSTASLDTLSSSPSANGPVHKSSETWLNFRTSPVNSEISKDGLPFYTLMTCLKTGTTATETPLPESMAYFRASATCGDQAEFPQTDGYFLMVAPDKDVAARGYGKALSNDYRKPLHTHPAVKYEFSKTQAYAYQESIKKKNTGSGASSSTSKWGPDPYDDWDITPEQSGPDIPYILLMNCSGKPATSK